MGLNKTIYQIMNRNNGWNRHDGKFGIEIETETVSPYEIPSLGYWDHTRDGSLRNFGVEYVTAAPVSEDSLTDALKEFSELKFDFIEGSISTSVHVHRNVLNELPIVVANVLTAYSLLEPMLCKYAGVYRESNLFCLQIRDAEGGMSSIEELIRYISSTGNRGGYLDGNRMKYAAMNVGSFYRFGSLEFRAMRGVTNSEEIRKWIEIIDCLFQYASSKEDPYDILSDFQSQSASVIQKIFGEYSSDLIYDGWEEDCDMNLWYGLRIASLSDSWENFGQPQPVKISKSMYDTYMKRRLNTVSRAEPNESDKRAVITHLVSIAGGNGLEEGKDWVFDEDKKEKNSEDLAGPRPTGERLRTREQLNEYFQQGIGEVPRPMYEIGD
jgi:hypothetical protein